MRRTQAERRQAARDQMVQAALRVFALKGYAAASMEDIRLAAGCSKGGLYHHFPSKQALLAAVVERLACGALLRAPSEEAAARVGLSAAATGRVLIDIWAEAAREPQVRGSLESATGDTAPPALSDLLAIGALVEALTRASAEDAPSAAERLGIVRPAA